MTLLVLFSKCSRSRRELSLCAWRASCKAQKANQAVRKLCLRSQGTISRRYNPSTNPTETSGKEDWLYKLMDKVNVKSTIDDNIFNTAMLSVFGAAHRVRWSDAMDEIWVETAVCSFIGKQPERNMLYSLKNSQASRARTSSWKEKKDIPIGAGSKIQASKTFLLCSIVILLSTWAIDWLSLRSHRFSIIQMTTILVKCSFWVCLMKNFLWDLKIALLSLLRAIDTVVCGSFVWLHLLFTGLVLE